MSSNMTLMNEKINRRRWLSLVGRRALLAGAGLPMLTACDWLTPAAQHYLLAAQGATAEQFSLGWVAPQGSNESLLTGFRGHGLCQHPQQRHQVMLFARRPGWQAWLVDVKRKQLLQTCEPAKQSYFTGHGCFHPGGDYLLTAEANIETTAGTISVRHSRNLQVLEQFPSYGLGLHEIKLLADGKTLVAANGGIKTHPSTGRKKLNLDTMDSSLAFIDVVTGQLLQQLRLPEPKASIRHLDVTPDGKVAVALQLQREAAGHNELVPLTALYQPERAEAGLVYCQTPTQICAWMQDYAGSIVINPLSQQIAATSPRGDIAVFWSLRDGKYSGFHRFHDVCGVAVSTDNTEFIFSNSAGQIRYLDAVSFSENKSKRRQFASMHWDNHLLVAQL